MKRIIVPLALLLISHWAIVAAPPGTTNRVLSIASSATAVSGGKATLTIGTLTLTTNVYGGDYTMKVSPYFFKSEKGKLAIVVPAESLAKVTHGVPVNITGTATSKDGHARRIDAVATPADNNRGALKLWFVAGGRKMVFNTSYQFARE
ncbi:MAG TPA: hypothetical protein VK530_16525 [Candidatus Acidoferrum sp.]|nr:hypothetical protein [Candidatus Acidoferrum sp.]